MIDFTLNRNLAGRLQLTSNDGNIHDGVNLVRAFPIAAPEEGLSIVGRDGHELAWVPQLNTLKSDLRAIIDEELAQREFMPEIQRIIHVSSFATPSTWQLKTNRGDCELTLKAEDHIRRLTHNSLLITDGHGINFLIGNIDQLDKHSRKLLDRFL
jgi:hypothetical protein